MSESKSSPTTEPMTLFCLWCGGDLADQRDSYCSEACELAAIDDHEANADV